MNNVVRILSGPALLTGIYLVISNQRPSLIDINNIVGNVSSNLSDNQTTTPISASNGNTTTPPSIVTPTTTPSRLPFLYEYFTDGLLGRDQNFAGLVAENRRFTLNGKEIRIVSGSLHYFRVHPALWRDRLRKLRAMGANTVDSYVPWNLHEPRRNQFDFGERWQNNDFSEFLDIRRFLWMCQEEDLLVLLRPGPFITAEWDFGGLPSWLQRDPEMRVRENNEPYLNRVRIYMMNLLQRVQDLQFTRGGPVIAIQLENEYSDFSHRSMEYLQLIKDIFDQNGLNESLYFTSDNKFVGVAGSQGSLPGMLRTANFQSETDRIFGELQSVQPDMPLFAGEFWSGWFTYWGQPYEQRRTSTANEFGRVLEEILGRWNASVNIYMFHGGTNFGFMAGGNAINNPPYLYAVTTSYDYGAPLTEAGDYTDKYEVAQRLIAQYSIPRVRLPTRPPESRKVIYPTLGFERYLNYGDILERIPSSAKFSMRTPVSMENLPMNGDSGQSYGYIIYRKQLFISSENVTIMRVSWPRDVAFLLVDGKLAYPVNNSSAYWINSIREFPLNVQETGNHTIDVFVEPLTRVNYGSRDDFIQQKGIAPVHQSKIEINGEEVNDIEIIAAEFSNSWIRSLNANVFNLVDRSNSSEELRGPVLLQTSFEINDEPADTFLDMSRWNKGIVFVNGFNIGRYWRIGPQQNLYVPGPFLRRGPNTITVFEQIAPSSELVFSDRPNFGEPGTS